MLLCSVTIQSRSHASHWVGLKSKSSAVALLSETKAVTALSVSPALGASGLII